MRWTEDALRLLSQAVNGASPVSIKGKVQPMNKKAEKTEKPKFVCRKCGYRGGSSHGLAAHYRVYPSHRISVPSADPVLSPTLNPPSALLFCPHCGMDLKPIQDALELYQRMNKGNVR